MALHHRHLLPRCLALLSVASVLLCCGSPSNAGDAGARTDGQADRPLTDQSLLDQRALDAGSPELVAPELVAPDLFAPDLIAPDLFAPDLTTADGAATDRASRDTAAPDLTSPDLTGPDAELGDAALGDRGVPPEQVAVTSRAVTWAAIPEPRPQWEYGPSIVLEGGTYYMFYCAPHAYPVPWDSIRLVTSADGLSWSENSMALTAYGRYATTSVCDPSVVRFRGVYLMYHTCINVEDSPDGYRNNRICVAVADSIDGPYHPYDLPVVQDLSCPSDWTAAYCVGQPSAVVHDQRVWLYYSLAAVGSNRIHLAHSSDGLAFTQANGGQPVIDRRNVSVKVERSTGLFFMVQGEVGTATLPWTASTDGVHWMSWDGGRLLAGNPSLPAEGHNHNPGIVGDGAGTFDGMSSVLYGSSYDAGWANWHLYRSDLVVNPALNDCSGCAVNSCDAVCQIAAGGPTRGHCAVPGSIDPDLCCGCTPVEEAPDCSGCAAGCVAACRAAGYEIGVCANPGSTDPGSCCGCY